MASVKPVMIPGLWAEIETHDHWNMKDCSSLNYDPGWPTNTGQVRGKIVSMHAMTKYGGMCVYR